MELFFRYSEILSKLPCGFSAATASGTQGQRDTSWKTRWGMNPKHLKNEHLYVHISLIASKLLFHIT